MEQEPVGAKEGLDLGLAVGGADAQSSDVVVRVVQRHRRLAGPGRLDNRRRSPKPDLLAGCLRPSDDAMA